MKKKILGILVMTLLILTAIPAVGIPKHASSSSEPLPDLEVQALDRFAKTFEGWFENIGDAEITDFTMHWYVDGEEITEKRTVYPEVLSPGDWDTRVANLAKYISSGWHTIKFCINYGSERIDEITWSNNCIERTHFFLFGDFSMLPCISVGAISNNFEETQIQTNEKEPEYEPLGYTPIDIVTPKTGKNINKNAPLHIITERLNNVCCDGPTRITVTIQTCGPESEVIASGSVIVWLLY